MLSLATFGAGFLMRPLGAIILGAYIDHHGRRKGLLVTLALMAVIAFLFLEAAPLAAEFKLSTLMENAAQKAWEHGVPGHSRTVRRGLALKHYIHMRMDEHFNPSTAIVDWDRSIWKHVYSLWRDGDLEKRLSEALGEHAWRESGLGNPPDIDALHQQITHLEQQAADLRLQLEERDEDLAAARTANRELMTRINTPHTKR